MVTRPAGMVKAARRGVLELKHLYSMLLGPKEI
jgi:hypothetical protein